jgi:GT2 family glycosyltransferase
VAEHADYAIVVVSHDHVDTLTACLSAVAELDPSPSRVVVVDNGSSDGSAEVAASFADCVPLELIRESTNRGFAAAVNTGFAATDEAWMLSLNPDCAPRRDFVARLLEASFRAPVDDRVAAVTGRLLRATGSSLEAEQIIDAAGMVVTPSGRHFDRGSGEPDDGRLSRTAWVFGGTGAATLYRREALEDVAYTGEGPFAESFFAYREDAELAWRLQWRGWRALYVPDAVASHRRRFRPEGGRRGHRSINRLSVRNRFLLRWHCADYGWHLRCLPWWLLRDLLVIGACLTIERSSLGALAELWRLRADARRRRRWVMNRRTIPPRQISRWFRIGGWAEEIDIR